MERSIQNDTIEERLFIVALYNEDTDWIPENAVIIKKDIDVPNTGREASSYLHYIVENYDNLPFKMTFCQGNPFDHCPNILSQDYFGDFTPHGEIFECDVTGAPHHSGLPIKSLADMMDVEIPKIIQFIPGAQFTVSKELILKKPKEYYEKLLKIANEHPDAPWVFERLWSYILC
jgi:hypothetical protein